MLVKKWRALLNTLTLSQTTPEVPGKKPFITEPNALLFIGTDRLLTNFAITELNCWSWGFDLLYQYSRTEAEYQMSTLMMMMKNMVKNTSIQAAVKYAALACERTKSQTVFVWRESLLRQKKKRSRGWWAGLNVKNRAGKRILMPRTTYRKSPVAEVNWILGLSVVTTAIREADIYLKMTE